MNKNTVECRLTRFTCCTHFPLLVIRSRRPLSSTVDWFSSGSSAYEND
ncbi:MAG: hypothetical protein ACLFUF_07680 [Opitutales bacterium]